MGMVMISIIPIDRAQDIDQSRLVKNSFQRTRPNVMESAPPINSGTTNSPIVAENTSTDPDIIPDFANGTVILQNVFVGRQPKSYADSIYDLSTFSRTAYIGNIIKGK